ncbi:MAG: hypothetical protein KC416_12535 [Myxococcales bacterium]|nr:hypothetical protein [Myxococcales bacterium]
MMKSSIRLHLGLLALFLVLPACGGASGTANVKPESMPPGASFTGVWFSPQYGEMHMRQSGGAVIGEYAKDMRTGRLQGTVTGNLLKFSWTEERELVQGRPTITRGRGYFRLVIGEDDRQNLLGEWGIDNAEVGGGPWNAYLMRNRKPNLSTDTTVEGPGGATGTTGPGPDDAADDGLGDELDGL